ncbi:hypothetical protein B8W90_08185 [Staphylococcus hominis]|nr:hypothetical protein B8W90_08185 [Staphylococcus hominis]
MAKVKIKDWLIEENLILIEGWARDGLTNEQIASNIGVSRDTLYRWAKRNSDISDALKRGKEVIDREVESSLLKKALGYEYEEECVTQYGEIVKVKRYAKPDVTAQIFWLKNRKPHQWRDKQNIAHEIKKDIDLSNLTDEELRVLAASYSD